MRQLGLVYDDRISVASIARGGPCRAAPWFRTDQYDIKVQRAGPWQVFDLTAAFPPAHEGT